MDSYTPFLTQIGLSDKEAAVYLALVELGKAGAQELATQSKVKRATVYTIVASLMKRGLVGTAQESVGGKASKQVFYAEDPGHLEHLIAERERELARTKADASTHIADLRRLHLSRGTRPVVRYFEGDEGLRDLRKDIRTTSGHENPVAFTDLDALLRRFPGIYSASNSPRIKKKALAQILYTSTRGPIAGVHDPSKYREARWVTFTGGHDFDGDISIYRNMVSITSFRAQPVSVLIEHEDIARIVRALLTLAWEGVNERDEPSPTVSLEDIDKYNKK